ncbi:MAG: TIGR04283 family arsenosugar biosynthesis glycosyltransferase [Pseudomonadota bacterium]
MPAPLTVIIPTLNAAATLPRTLGGLMPGLEAGLIRQLVVSDAGSRDATGQIAEAAGADLITGAPGRGGQLLRGAEAARGDWLLFVHADTVLTPGWPEAVRGHLAHPEAAAYFRLAFDASGVAPALVAGWANLRSRIFGLPYGDQGLLLHRDLYAAVGGFRDQPLMEDVAMARALRGRLRPLDAIAATSAARYQADGWIRRGGANIWLLARYFLGASPDTLAKAYRSGRAPPPGN